MKIHLRNRGVAEKTNIEKEVTRQSVKLSRQLKRFNPDALELHVHIHNTKRPPQRFTAKVTLTLPTRRLHAEAETSRPVPALKQSFAELFRELKTFKAKLRREDDVRSARRARRRVTA